MTQDEQDRKLAQIAKLSAGELRGWVRMIMRKGSRELFDGERAALIARAKELEVTL